MQLLAAINTIYDIDEPVQTAIQQMVKRRVLPKGTVILAEGELSDDVHFIEKGLVRAFYCENGREITSWMADEGRFIWPLPSYLLRRPSRETIQLLEQTTILSLTRQNLDALKQQYDTFNHLQCRIMERYIVLYDIRVRILLLPKAKERLEAYIREFPEIYRRVPLRHIATYLGIDPATLSRIRSGFKRKLKDG